MATQKIVPPSKASTIYIPAAPGHTFQFDFDPSSAVVDRVGNDLAFTFHEGGTTVIRDFFVTEGTDLPGFVLSDGTEISSLALLETMNPALDLTPVPVPGANANGSGVGEYEDGAGELLAGIYIPRAFGGFGSFDNADTSPWGRGIEGRETFEGLDLSIWQAGMGTAPTPPGFVPDPQPDPGPDPQPDPQPDTPHGDKQYSARAVLYRTSRNYPEDGGEIAKDPANRIYFQVIHEGKVVNQEGYAPSLNFFSANQNRWFTDPLHDGDSWYVALTKVGLQALQQAEGDGLSCICWVHLKDFGTYSMQIVVNESGSFSSSEENQRSNGGHPLDIYEFHTEINGTGEGTRIGSEDVPNAVWFMNTDTTNPVLNGNFTAGSGNDIVCLHGEISDLKLDMGEGNDLLMLKAETWQEAQNYYEHWWSTTGYEGTHANQLFIEVKELDVPDAIFDNVKLPCAYDRTLFLDTAELDQLDLWNVISNLSNAADTLDFSGGNTNVFKIDDLLENIELFRAFSSIDLDETKLGTDNLPPELQKALLKSLRITGDAQDSIDLTGSTFTKAVDYQIEYDSLDYDVYTNATGEYLLIQSGLL